MKKIGIDVRVLTSQSAGIGSYVRGLVWGLSTIENKKYRYVLYTNTDDIEEITKLNLPENRFEIKIFITNELFWYVRVWLDARKEKISLLYSTHSTLFALLPKVKTALVVHDLSAIIFPELHTRKVKFLAGLKMLTRACRKVAFIVVPSQSTQNDLKKFIPEVSSKVHVIPDALYNHEKKHEVLGHEHNRFSEWTFPFILYLGTIEPRKNIVRLLEAFHVLSENEFPKHKLVIAGKKGWLSDSVFEKVTELNLRDKVIFPGYVSDDEREWLFEYAQVFGYISLYEGFGFPVLRAMDEGLLVLTSNISSIPEIIGRNYPYLVDPEDIDDIIAKLRMILSLSHDEKESLIMKNKKRASKFSWKTHATEVLELIS